MGRSGADGRRACSQREARFLWKLASSRSPGRLAALDDRVWTNLKTAGKHAVQVGMAIVEPPAFAEVKQSRTESRMPILDVLREHPRNVVLAMAARLAENGAFYL